jgi:hypothetical protein
MLADPVSMIDGVGIYVAPPGREYAVVEHSGDERTVCDAYGIGGKIDVHCDLPAEGTLMVKEHNWTGWHAMLGERELPIDSQASWLVVDVPAGEQVIELRYRPWDAWVGIGLAGLGVVVALLAWWWPGSAALQSMMTRNRPAEPEQAL